MKKLIFNVITLCLFLIVFAGCSSDARLTFNARVVHVSEYSVTVDPIKIDGISRPSGRVMFGTAGLDDIGVSIDDIISITYTGEILYTHPGQITVTRWSLVERNESD